MEGNPMNRNPQGTAWLAAALLSMLLLTAPAAGDEPLPLIIDTDMGLDDMRAIALILDADHLKVHAVSTVFGSQEPRPGGRAMIRLLGGVGHRRIPVSPGAKEPLEGKFEPPAWRPVCESATDNLFGHKGHILLHEPAHEMLSRLARREGDQVRLVCLGPLTNLALALEADPGLPGIVHTLIIACADTKKPHFNITADPEAALRVLEADWKRVVLVGGCTEISDADFADVLQGIEKERIGGETARALGYLCGSAEHLQLGDELASLYLIRPSLFTLSDPFCAGVTLEESGRGLIVSRPEDPGPCRVESAVPAVPGPDLVRAMLDSIGDLLVREPLPAVGSSGHQAHEGAGTLLSQFPPLDKSGYREDVAMMVEQIVEAHGTEEWRWSVLTGEIHGHLGIYSVVGVKMGIRALEILGAPRELVELSPHCGSQPPLSCLQDGLMVSTGATPGRGLLLSSTGALLLPPLYVDEEEDDFAARGPAAAASFYLGERMITIRLLPDVQQLIGERIGALARKYGGTSGDDYFTALRSEALQLQLELDRHEIFEVFE
jgi:pyrimidine-specific ribonucleoside hydrolase